MDIFPTHRLLSQIWVSLALREQDEHLNAMTISANAGMLVADANNAIETFRRTAVSLRAWTTTSQNP